MTEEVYEVYALKYAERNNRTRRESFLFEDDHASPHPMDYFVWLIRNENRSVLVDTGYDRVEGTRRNRAVLQDPHEVLSAFGVDPGSLETVVITHLHYDHAGTLDHFPNARFYLQAAEMAYATGPCMCDAVLQYPFTVSHICDMVKRVYSGRVTFFDGMGEVAPGITAHLVGGHSRGLQCVRVKTARGWVVLASDASHYYENFQRRKLFPIVVDAENMLKGFDTLYSLAETEHHIIPGHDPLVRTLYPAVSNALDGIAYRLDVEPKG
ncbi:MAG: N-acyl homoserine lactonase family protein [Pseudomonadota bacterium]